MAVKRKFAYTMANNRILWIAQASFFNNTLENRRRHYFQIFEFFLRFLRFILKLKLFNFRYLLEMASNWMSFHFDFSVFYALSLSFSKLCAQVWDSFNSGWPKISF